MKSPANGANNHQKNAWSDAKSAMVASLTE
jgi:hypothetical protein